MRVSARVRAALHKCPVGMDSGAQRLCPPEAIVRDGRLVWDRYAVGESPMGDCWQRVAVVPHGRAL